jgi:hypothetical protein
VAIIFLFIKERYWAVPYGISMTIAFWVRPGFRSGFVFAGNNIVSRMFFMNFIAFLSEKTLLPQ